MAKLVVLNVGYNLSGDGFGGLPYAFASSNTNAPPPSEGVLNAGDNTIQAPPATFTVNGVIAIPPTGSANVKSIKAVSGDSNPGNWTSQSVLYPAVAAGTFVIRSAGSETLTLLWF